MIKAINLPKITLNESERLWLQTLYDKIRNGDKISYKLIRSQLYKKLPEDFHPKSIDRNLIEHNGEDITLLGVFAIEPESDILDKANKVLNAIKNILIENPETEEIKSELISNKIGIEEREVAMIIKLVSPYGRFWSSASQGQNVFGYSTINIGRDNEIYDQYLSFNNIAELINKRIEEIAHQTTLEKQNKIGELLLKRLADNKGTLNIDQQSHFFTEERNYEWTEFVLVRDNLINEGFIEWQGDDKYRIKLTSKGWDATGGGQMKFDDDENGVVIKRHEIFISYSHVDSDKVDLIKKELENSSFNPLIIAFNREATKPLTKKVEEGILKAEVIIPILTNNSIGAQWINQEIGYSIALKKRIVPIVENDILNNLKGFIHKQIDLPYLFKSNISKGIENKEFIDCFRILLQDLEKIYGIESAKFVPPKSAFDQALEKIDKKNEEKEFQASRINFLESEKASQLAKESVNEIFTNIKRKIRILIDKKKFPISIEEDFFISNPYFIAKADTVSISIHWLIQFDNNLKGSTLSVNLFNGIYGTSYKIFNDGENLTAIKKAEIKFSFDINKNNIPGWLNLEEKKFYSIDNIVDYCLDWLIDPKSETRNFGISFDLSGRKLIIKPAVNNIPKENGKVVVNILVNREGNVLSALPGARGTTTTSTHLFEMAKEAALKTKFDNSSEENQKGTISFAFAS